MDEAEFRRMLGGGASVIDNAPKVGSGEALLNMEASESALELPLDEQA